MIAKCIVSNLHPIIIDKVNNCNIKRIKQILFKRSRCTNPFHRCIQDTLSSRAALGLPAAVQPLGRVRRASKGILHTTFIAQVQCVQKGTCAICVNLTLVASLARRPVGLYARYLFSRATIWYIVYNRYAGTLASRAQKG